MTKPFDPTKPVQTRDGRKARIVCTDMKSDYPIITVITKPDGREYMVAHAINGLLLDSGELTVSDLINTPERTSRWANVQNDSQWGYATREIAASACSFGRLVEVIFEDGKPVDVKLHREDK